TAELARSYSIYQLRQRFYENGGYLKPGGVGFGLEDYLYAKLDIVFAGYEPTNFILVIATPMNVTDFIGSYNYQVYRTAHGTVRYDIENTTSLESGTRLAPRESLLDVSLEQYWSDPEAYKDRKIVSILSSKTTRDATTWYGVGGGDYTQRFSWEEPYNGRNVSRVLRQLGWEFSVEPPCRLPVARGRPVGGPPPLSAD
ncbi:MAG: hypothetical protein AABY97_05750, partial [Chloroflexota bacterium]